MIALKFLYNANKTFFPCMSQRGNAFKFSFDGWNVKQVKQVKQVQSLNFIFNTLFWFKQQSHLTDF